MKLTRQDALEIAAKLVAEGNRLIGQRIGIVGEESESTSKGGIIIPDSAKRKLLRGRIVSIGEGVITRVEDIPPGSESRVDRSCIGLALGDYCTFTKYNGQLHEILFMDGTTQVIEVMTTSDLYFVWK